MATRTIVTSQPDVACDVCERRLLRGEQPDIFIDAGRRLTVCELCAPRAAHEGWMRERDSHAVALPPLRPRRGRSFLERLRGSARPSQGSDAGPGGTDAGAGLTADPVPARGRARDRGQRLELEEWAALESTEAGDGEGGLAHPEAEGQAEPPSWPGRALEVFNASEFPRRIAGVTRSLGAPEVSVRSAEHLESVVLIVVAWELCWYRYEVDLSDGLQEVSVREQGTELTELPREDRLANALAGDDGSLLLLAA